MRKFVVLSVMLLGILACGGNSLPEISTRRPPETNAPPVATATLALTDTPSPTETPLPTATPIPTDTTTPTPLPTLDPSIALQEGDLPSGWKKISPESLVGIISAEGLISGFKRISPKITADNFVAYEGTGGLLISLLMYLPLDQTEINQFDIELSPLGMAASFSESPGAPLILPNSDTIGDKSIGASILSENEVTTMNMVLARKGHYGLLVGLVYPTKKNPTLDVLVLARVLVERIAP